MTENFVTGYNYSSNESWSFLCDENKNTQKENHENIFSSSLLCIDNDYHMLTCDKISNIVPENQAICFYRLSIVEKFEGDDEAGFDKPDPEVVSLVKKFLINIYGNYPNLESPIISPARDGEIIVSWRKKRAYFLCCFDEGGQNFEWIFNQSKMIGGISDSESVEVQQQLPFAVTCFFHPEEFFSINRVTENTTVPIEIHSTNEWLTSVDDLVRQEIAKWRK